MTDQFKKGDKVEWRSSQGKVQGTVKQKVTSPTDIKNHHVNASREEPQYRVESDKTGSEAVHKPGSLTKR